jgi:asparagine synthase (glutamine-hydrolysing)
MCGIAGIWNLDGRPVQAESINRFTDSLAHRGPDGRGTWHDATAGIALGHRRLAILDLSDDGRQPMSFSEGRYWITYNGEVYNFLELRSELKGEGFQFHSQSDTEVILAAYQHWGPAMLARFNGMWAFAIYDREKHELFLARDRFGIKPLFYTLGKNRFAFASELKAFGRLDGFAMRMDRECAHAFLQNAFSVEGTARTIIHGVERLQSGYYGIVKGGQLTRHRWWCTLDHLVDAPPSLEKQAEEFQRLFYDSVRLRMRSDVPIGTCLSGGFDSTSVVCAMAELGRNSVETRKAKKWQQTFVATFPGCDNDESQQAEEVVRFAGVNGNFFPINEDHALAELDRVLYDFDDLYISLPTAPWLIYKAMRQHRVIVSLDGHGADELMGAYKQIDYLLLHDAPSWTTAPFENLRRVRDCFRLLPSALRPHGPLQTLRQALRISLVHHPHLRRLKQNLKRMRPRASASNELVLNGKKSEPTSEELKPVGGSDHLPEHWGPLNRELYTMFHSTLLPTILRNFDRISMAHGIEVRMPFMDWRLVCYLMSLPDESKIGDGVTKRVARQAMKGRIPESIRTSKVKIGFNSPLPKWLGGPLREWASQLARVSSGGHDLVNVDALRKRLNAHARGQPWDWSASEKVWSCLHLLWFEQNFFKP